jgi:hypothetical protein
MHDHHVVGLAAGDRRSERGDTQIGSHPIGDRVADHPGGEQVLDRAGVDLALAGGVLDDVGDPHAVRGFGREVPLQVVIVDCRGDPCTRPNTSAAAGGTTATRAAPRRRSRPARVRRPATDSRTPDRRRGRRSGALIRCASCQSRSLTGQARHWLYAGAEKPGTPQVNRTGIPSAARSRTSGQLILGATRRRGGPPRGAGSRSPSPAAPSPPQLHDLGLLSAALALGDPVVDVGLPVPREAAPLETGVNPTSSNPSL